ncbi:GumC family protein [Xanthomonas sp. WHRI 8391]|uniref:GumC family protein n=1 Tax=Xanthomonas TaxID=338 RepID=UPI001A26CC8B|nr:GumC family protein [Xanthomonas hortorum]MBG3850665.1 GumC family protein [Xanthomonas hortorum pv. carotae]UTS72675.1 GumC family protein [Xanthomonas hortorum]
MARLPMSMNSENRSSSSHRHGHLELADVGLLDYWRALVSQRWLIIGVTLFAVLLAFGITLLMPEKYRATSTLQIERDSLNVVNVDNLMPVESPQDRDFYQTQYQLLQSRSLARAVIREAKLDQEPAFKVQVDEALEKAAAKNPEAGKSVDSRQAIVERTLTDTLLAGLVVEPILNSRLVYVNYDSPDPVLAAKIANTYTKVFIVSTQERRMNASSFATKFLSERLEQLRGKVEDSEKTLVSYSTQEQIVSMGDDKPSLAAQNLGDLNAMLASAQDTRIKAEAAWRQVSTGDSMSLPQVLSNPLIQSLRGEQIRLNTEYQQKLSTFKPDYPEMRRLKAQIEESRRQINGEVINIRQSLKAAYDASVQQERLLNERIAGLRSNELDLQSRSIQYNMLKRDVDTNRQLYDALLQRYKEIGVASNVGANNVTIVDTADVPTSKTSPKLKLNLALGFIFGVFLGVAVALVRYFLRGNGPETRLN